MYLRTSRRINFVVNLMHQSSLHTNVHTLLVSM